MSVFGYIRFSYLGRSDAKLSRATDDKQARFDLLYAPDRMSQRFHFFEQLTLPSLRAQKDPEFEVIVLASTVMPRAYRDRLTDLVATVPQVRVLFSDADHVTYALNPEIERMTAGLEGATAHFRLDDDDAVDCNLVARLRQQARTATGHHFVTYPRGLFLADVDGEVHLTRKFEPYIAAGFAFINPPGTVLNPYQCRHGKHHRQAPSFMDPAPYAYIHCAHASSDTRAAQTRKLRKAQSFDTAHGTERGKAHVDKILQRNFPQFSREGLEGIMLDGRPRAGDVDASGVAAL